MWITKLFSPQLSTQSKQMEKVLLISNMQEKKEGRGEDSNPILFSNNDSIFLGVFDGMGGAGGAECVSDFSHDGLHMTKAYVGSRIVKEAIEKSIHENPGILFSTNLDSILTNIIKERYAKEKEKYPPKSKGGLRSALIKEYPTTLAISCITRTTGHYSIDSFWAGDSRNYIWNQNGLFQISVDDLKGNLDPMQNLHEDAPMSNCIQADGTFKINHKNILVSNKDKFIVISATDGCFGYYPSPMDFEKALLDSLNNASSIEEFEKNLTTAFAFVTADDFSFSIAAVGFKNFNELKSCLGSPTKLVKEYFNKRRYFEQEVRKTEEKIAKLRDRVDSYLISLWPEYKRNYLKYMDSDEER